MRGRAIWLFVLTLVGPWIAPGSASARRERKVVELPVVAERLRDAHRVISDAERAAGEEKRQSEEQLAKRLVDGQLKLRERDLERAAVVFLDLLENHAESHAAPQARYFLGEALMLMGMARWAAEMFSSNLADQHPEARRFHQRSVARLFDLRHPARAEGFARRPGISATPETRARLAALGLGSEVSVVEGVIGSADAERLERWAESYPPSERQPELRYAYGRYLYLAGKHERARNELDGLNPVDIPLAVGGPESEWRVRAAYVAGAASLALGDLEDALERFGRITKARPKKIRDLTIVELAWMAIARIRHDYGQTDDAVRAYRRIGRDSVFFPEAMYETAWTMLRDGRFERAVQALDLLLIYDPDSPLVPEIKQLRGKIRIQQRDYQVAEEEFLALRRSFAELTDKLEKRLAIEEETANYFSAVIGEDMRHFSLAALLPVGAVPIAKSLPRAVQGEVLARTVGELEAELRETRELLARMEEAVRAKERARLFTDLGAHLASLDTAERDLLEMRSDLVRRLAAGNGAARLAGMEGQRTTLERRVDEPLGAKTGARHQAVDRLQELSLQAHRLELVVAAQRAQLVAAERYFEETRREQKVDRQGFLTQAAELRASIGELENQLVDVRARIGRAQASLRFTDPFHDARRAAIVDYKAHLEAMYAEAARAKRDRESDGLWQRMATLESRIVKARQGLERAAGIRLQKAMVVLVEERTNLDNYLVELRGVHATTRGVVAEVMAAAYEDVVAELKNLVLRSEVGLLDVAWSMKEVEQQAVERLQKARDDEMLEIERNLELGLKELE